MPTNALSSALKTKQQEGKLSIVKLSKAIGANVQSVSGVLRGKSFPNKTTAPKYAKFLGISVEDLVAMGKPTTKATGKPKAAKKAAKQQKSVRKAKPTKPSSPRQTAGITLAEAAELASDALAVAIHRATDDQRRIVAAVLKA